jgi:hypothetical protein
MEGGLGPAGGPGGGGLTSSGRPTVVGHFPTEWDDGGEGREVGGGILGLSRKVSTKEEALLCEIEACGSVLPFSTVEGSPIPRRPWKDWQYSPRYSLAQDGKKVKIQAPVEWVVYASVKAVWKYEPGYAERQAGPDYASRLITLEEEKEALAAYLSQEHPLPNLMPIVDDGFTDEFLYYEVLAPKAPGALLLLPREIFLRVAEYVDKYH